MSKTPSHNVAARAILKASNYAKNVPVKVTRTYWGHLTATQSLS
jgi:hypothetical protein